MEVIVLKMTLENLTKIQIDDARVEATRRHLNFNVDEKLNEMYENYMDSEDNLEGKKQIELKIIHTFERMLKLDYSPICIRYYQQLWYSIK